jgi:hypothetical protein
MLVHTLSTEVLKHYEAVVLHKGEGVDDQEALADVRTIVTYLQQCCAISIPHTETELPREGSGIP